MCLYTYMYIYINIYIYLCKLSVHILLTAGVIGVTFCSTLYVPMTVHREQSVKKEYQQDATI